MPLATECLDGISKVREDDSRLLYACVLEAQKSGNRLQVVRALSAAHNSSTSAITPGLHLPTLLRYFASSVIV